jgi:hypothetical protein
MTATVGPQSKEGGILEERPQPAGWVGFCTSWKGERRGLGGVGHRGAKKVVERDPKRVSLPVANFRSWFRWRTCRRIQDEGEREGD